ncbi:MAG: hypothetical protein OEQ81_11870 [Flavobacteriaceae bacterium]|nr:hypothetical protein [Flavobacteriaceae bacterium]
MKRVFRKLNVAAILIAAVLVSSCNKDASDEVIVDQENFDVQELKASDEAELITEEVLNVGEDVYAADELSFSNKGYTSDFLPDCVTITTVITSTSKEKTIDFGDGCELPNGNVLSGIIYLSYLKDTDVPMNTLSMSLENFTFNGVSVEGSASVDRVRSNENGNPQSDASASFNAVWPDGSTASFTGNRTREWIEGYGSGFWGDNVFLISGSATYTGPLGNVFMKETITPLRRELACRFIVSGVLEISRNDATVSLDFGDGSCDAVGILTYPDGSTKEIFLRRFKP